MKDKEILSKDLNKITKNYLINTLRYKNISFYITERYNSKNSMIIEFARENKIKTFFVKESFLKPSEIGSPLPDSISIEIRNVNANEDQLISEMNSTIIKDSFLIKRSEKLINELKEFEGRKSAEESNLEFKKRVEKKILIIGENEIARELNNIKSSKINNFDLVMIAKYENPTADLFYLPYLNQNVSNPQEFHDINEVAFLVDNSQDIGAILRKIDMVYTFSSILGFKALLNNKKVVTYGTPFYSGWGLTDDRIEVPNRGRTLTLEECFTTYALNNIKYFHPFTNEQVDMEEIINLLRVSQNTIRKREAFEEDQETTKEEVYLIGFDQEQFEIMKSFMQDNILVKIEKNQGIGKFRKLIESNPRGKAIIWTGRNKDNSLGVDNTQKLIEIVIQKDYDKLYVDNGLINYHKFNKLKLSPFSVVFDDKDNPYQREDDTKLIKLLSAIEIDSSSNVNRSTNLISEVRNSLYKLYDENLIKQVIEDKTDTEIILVIGTRRVSDSIPKTSNNVNSLDLVWIAKLENPNAIILFVPDPVNSERENDIKKIEKLAKVLDSNVNISAFLNIITKIYTKDSPFGLIGLIGEKPVVTLGTPFYSGWGLTDDRNAIPKNKKLSLESLVAVSLIEYPKYINPFTKKSLSVESSLMLQEEVSRIEDEYGISNNEDESLNIETLSEESFFDLKSDLENKKVGIVSPGLKKNG
ncbi:capsular polysaccharide export protein, LipB/KpsS family [Bacillus sp. m3-13]|uniref:capsular polysaccharide export protein, LipB/KpsS family n=1 Tax=Bacillus sp. m3-13 TaxID=406124 RepID=UPI0001E89E3A|nr:capsular polysaccharide biosynthesis protein [Bacillus sp. m3-13]